MSQANRTKSVSRPAPSRSCLIALSRSGLNFHSDGNLPDAQNGPYLAQKTRQTPLVPGALVAAAGPSPSTHRRRRTKRNKAARARQGALDQRRAEGRSERRIDGVAGFDSRLTTCQAIWRELVHQFRQAKIWSEPLH
jgi:hypothetical protein